MQQGNSQNQIGEETELTSKEQEMLTDAADSDRSLLIEEGIGTQVDVIDAQGDQSVVFDQEMQSSASDDEEELDVDEIFADEPVDLATDAVLVTQIDAATGVAQGAESKSEDTDKAAESADNSAAETDDSSVNYTPWLFGAGLIGGAAAAVAAGGGSSKSTSAVDQVLTFDDLEDADDTTNVLDTDKTSFTAEINGEGGEKTFTINAPNAEVVELVGTLVSVDGDGVETIKFTIDDIVGDTRTLKIKTDKLTSDDGAHRLVFDFSGEGGDPDNDVVTLDPASTIGVFSEIEIVAGTLNVLGIKLPAGTTFVVNSGLELSVSQFLATPSIASVTGHGEVSIVVTSAEEADVLEAFVAQVQDQVLIGTSYTIKVAEGVELGDSWDATELQAALDDVTYPSIPELAGLISNLETAIQEQIDSNEADIAALVDDSADNGGTATTASIAGLSAALTALHELAGELSDTFDDRLDAVEGQLAGITDTVKEYIDGKITTLQTAIAGNEADIVALIDDSADNGGTATTASIAGLQAAITALETATGSDVSGLVAEVGAPASGTVGDDDYVAATGLYLAIENAVSAAVSALEVNIADLKTQIDGLEVADISGLSTELTSLGDSISDLQTLAGDLSETFDPRLDAIEDILDGLTDTVVTYVQNEISALEGTLETGDYTTIEALSDAVKALEGAGLGDPTDLSSVAGQLAALAARLNALEAPSLITANELDNHIELFDYSGDSDFIRVEAGEGDDTINSFDGTTEIVGGLGADTINLTYADQSADTVIYQTVFDGQHLPVSEVSFSNDVEDYRQGTVLTLTINGTEYSHEVTAAEAGDIATVLSNFAAEIGAELMPVDVSDFVVGWCESSTGTLFVRVSDLDANGTYTVPDGYVFVSLNDDLRTHLIKSLPVELLPGEVFTLPDEFTYITNSGFGDELNNVVLQESVYNWYLVDDGYPYPAATLAERTVNADAVLANVYATADGTIKLIGLDGTALNVESGGDGTEAIYNLGVATQYTVSFSSDAADWPTQTNDDNSTVFDREISVTINTGTSDITVSADVVYNSDGTVDMTGSVADLVAAINADSSVNGLLTAAVSGTVATDLVLTGDAVPATAADVPTFTVESADVDQNGSQQEVTVSFSNDDADYYDGGTLSVTINGTVYTADMVDNDAVASVQALVTKVNTVLPSVLESAEQPSTEEIHKNASASVGAGVIHYVFSQDLTTYSDFNLDIRSTFSNDGEIVATGYLSGFGPETFNGQNFADIDAFLIAANTQLSATGLSITYNEITRTVDVISASGSFSKIVSWLDASGSTITDPYSITLTANTEAEAPLTVTDITLDYAGVLQTATIDLNDAATYTSYADDTAANHGDFADVYYDGGKVYATIAPVDADGHADADSAVTVSATMPDRGCGLILITEDPDGFATDDTSDIGAFTFTINGQDYTADASVNTIAGLLTWLETLAPIASAQIDPSDSTQIRIETYAGVASISSNFTRLRDTDEQEYYDTDNVSETLILPLEYSSQALADAINDAITNGTDSIDTLISSASVGTDGTITLTAANPGVETFNVTGVTLDYEGVKQLATISLNSDSSYSSTFNADGSEDDSSFSRGADIYYDGGKVYATITDLGDDLDSDSDDVSVTVSADMVSGAGETAIISGTAGIALSYPEVQSPDPYVRFITASGDTVSVGFSSDKGDTLGDFLARLESQKFVTSAAIAEDGENAGKIVIETIDGTQIDYIYWDNYTDGKEPYPDYISKEVLPGVSAADATSEALAAAINAETIEGGDLYGLIESASADGTEITLTAAEAGKQTFSVTDVTLDYQGVKQIATAQFSTEDEDYYTGGELSITIDTTPDVADDAESLITVTADMVNGNAADSIAALMTGIHGIVGDVSVADDGTITLTAPTASNAVAFTITDAEITTTGTKQESTVAFSSSADDYYDGGELSVTIDGVTISADMVEGQMVTYTASVALTDSVTFASEVPNVADLVLLSPEGDTVTIDWDEYDGDPISAVCTDLIDNVAAIADAGIDADGIFYLTLASGYEIDSSYSGYTTLAFDSPEGGFIFGNYAVVEKDGVSVQALADAIQDAIDQDPENADHDNPSLQGTIGEVSVSGTTITLTAADAGAASFSVKSATADVAAVTQVTELDFSATSDDDFYVTDDASNQGTLSVVIAGVTVTADMADSKSASIQNLADRIVALRDGTETVPQVQAIAAAVGTVEVSGDSLLLTGAAAGVDAMEVGDLTLTTPYINGSRHEVTIQFSNTYLDSDDILGESISITLDDITTTLTIDQDLLDSIIGDRSEGIIAALLTEVIADHQDGNSYLDLSAAANAQSGNILTFVADTRGVGLLDEVTVAVTADDGTLVSPVAAILEVIDPGVDDTTDSTDSSTVVVNDADDSGVAVTGADGYTLNDNDSADDGLVVTNETVEGVDPDPVDQTIVNPADNADYYGDSPILGVESTETIADYTGEGIDQTIVNPDDNNELYGDDPILGVESDETIADYIGEGIAQTVRNPDDDSTLQGADDGYYLEDSSDTTLVDGLYATGDTTDSLVDGTATGAIDVTDVTGSVEGSVSAADNTDDDWNVVQDTVGMEAYTWDDSTITTLFGGHDGADVITNFQVEIDKIAVDGDLADSLVSGDVEAFYAWNDFDLSLDEYGLVSAFQNTAQSESVTAADLDNAEAIADLLNHVFDFDGVATDNGVLSSSVFAVNAADDSSQTAIWVHEQSATGDDAVEAYELSLLALVHTIGGEFSATDFDGIEHASMIPV